MIQLLPPSVLADGTATLPARLREPAFRKRVRRELEAATDLVAPVQLIRAGRWKDLRFEYGAATPELIGTDFAAIAAARTQDPYDALFDVMAAQGDELADAVVIAQVYEERDVVAVLKHHTSMVGSDGYTLGASGPLANWRFHPRSYGTFPRVLRRYVFEQQVLPLTDAIHKMTAVPAKRFNLSERGMLAVGHHADVVAFDPAAIQDVADYEHPNEVSRGVEHVIVNGTMVLNGGAHQSTTPGRTLRGRY
jgi:N-acyl-D-aspartate/D-glutamate deacylase